MINGLQGKSAKSMKTEIDPSAAFISGKLAVNITFELVSRYLVLQDPSVKGEEPSPMLSVLNDQVLVLLDKAFSHF